jgi:hypothetical protein
MIAVRSDAVKAGSRTSGSGPIVMINGIVLQVHDRDSQVVSVGGEGSITGHGSALGAQEPPQGAGRSDARPGRDGACSGIRGRISVSAAHGYQE